MTEQQKVTKLYEELSPQKQAAFIALMRAIASMMTAMVLMNDSGGGGKK